MSFDEFVRAVTNKNTDLYNVRKLFRNEYLEKQNDKGFRPLHLACWNNRVRIVKFFLDECNCEKEPRDKGGWRPIHIVSWCGYKDILQLLISAQCELECYTKAMETPFHLASENNQHECINMIKEAIGNKEENSVLSVNKEIGFIAGNGDSMLLQKRKAFDINNSEIEKELKCDPECDHDLCVKGFSEINLENGEFIGEGGFGSVYKIEHRDMAIAIKKISIQSSQDKDYVEYNINKYRKYLIHENILHYFCSIKKSSAIFIFMEYMHGGSLHDKIDQCETGTLSCDEIRRISKQGLQGLAFLHHNKIIHRDIKADNILLDGNENVKLCDFGLSRILKSISMNQSNTGNKVSKVMTFCGTPNYMAPEVINQEPYLFPVDIWSFGATVVHMLTGKPPYHNLEDVAVIYRIGRYKKIDYKPLNSEMGDFLAQMLHSDPDNRASAESLLNHEFLTKSS